MPGIKRENEDSDTYREERGPRVGKLEDLNQVGFYSVFFKTKVAKQLYESHITG